VATYRAVEVACTALAGLLTAAHRASHAGPELEFRVLGSGVDSADPTRRAGVLAHRLGVDRTVPDPRIGGPAAPPLALTVGVLVVVRDEDPAATLALAGWAMSTLHDHPVLLPATLGASSDDAVFAHDERVQVTFDDLTGTELLALREAHGLATYDVLLPCVLTGILVASATGSPRTSDAPHQ